MSAFSTWFRARLGLHRPAAVPRRALKKADLNPSKKDPEVIRPTNHNEVHCDRSF